MQTAPHLLIVEDDAEIRRIVARFLRESGFRVSEAAEGRAMDKALADGRIDLVVLDVMLPGEDGLSLCRRLRAGSSIPIVMLTAMGDEVDRIVGLEMGADDYIAKPFNPRELLARIRAVLRRAAQQPVAGAERKMVLVFDEWRLDGALRRLFSPEGARVALTGAEFDLLLALCQHPRRVLNRDQLLDLTQGRAAGPCERSIDVLVSRIRNKIEREPRDPEIIKTVRLGGYMFTPDVVAA